jgi:hypothetical protein
MNPVEDYIAAHLQFTAAHKEAMTIAAKLDKLAAEVQSEPLASFLAGQISRAVTRVNEWRQKSNTIDMEIVDSLFPEVKKTLDRCKKLQIEMFSRWDKVPPHLRKDLPSPDAPGVSTALIYWCSQ